MAQFSSGLDGEGRIWVKCLLGLCRQSLPGQAAGADLIALPSVIPLHRAAAFLFCQSRGLLFPCRCQQSISDVPLTSRGLICQPETHRQPQLYCPALPESGGTHLQLRPASHFSFQLKPSSHPLLLEPLRYSILLPSPFP